ncbi:hypothetical protein ACFOSS_13085 [Pseudaeromonas sharmana]|uniref:NlpE C-terminal OB domain-containing protein n=1 Tax=Pseudaeromonas sharmana TaxID=328412 RepID=A0ABV8CQJ7_9GAMM
MGKQQHRYRRWGRSGHVLRGLGYGLLLVATASLGAVQPLSGLYRAGADVNSLQRCDSNLVYWVSGDNQVALALREYVLKHARRPFQPFYIELNGELIGRPRVGNGAGYDDVLRVESVEALSEQLPAQCQALPPEG